jgi:hypothetical protein
MNDDNPFLVSDEQLLSLRATRQGRISLAGYNYQAAYTVLRLARLVIPITPEDEDHPVRLRYDWGEDLDEVWSGGRVCFTQCKRVNNIGQPQPMAEVLESFAAKWVMVPEEEQHCIRFRLVCTDPRFAGGVLLSKGRNRERDKIKKHFCRNLERPPHARADRKLWQRQTDSLGHEFLFDTIWERTEAFCLPNHVHGSHPAGALLEGEREALSLLLTYGKIEQVQQEKALNRLRGLIHNNLIEFDPVSDQIPSLPVLEPRHIIRADVDNALFECRHGTQSPLLFRVVDRRFLAEQKALPKEPFVARPPTWPDVVHGQDDVVKFLERDQTEDLQGCVVQDLVKPLERGADNRLHALFVIGPPGAGKSTLVRRVLARLVDQGRVVVADVSTGLPLDEADTYRQRIAELALPGRPVILLLDDPLYAESPWLVHDHFSNVG